jgi:uncharacterized protein (DUF697 family)
MTTPHRKLMEKFGIVKASDNKSEAAIKMSLAETAGRAALTATVTFAVGLILKRMFEKTVEQSGAQTQPRVKPSSVAHTPPGSYRTPSRRPTSDQE